MIKYAVLITTKNRLEDLKITLERISNIISRTDVELCVYDDASTDGTWEYLNEHYKSHKLHRNDKNLGYIHNRNFLLNNTQALYAISLDDDAHFLSNQVLENIENYFDANKKCGVIACSIFWGKDTPENVDNTDVSKRVKGFVGCGHVWRIDIWKKIPDYPEWFIFYGEEEFAAYQLFKHAWEVHYVPEILVQHRVEVKKRKAAPDYLVRSRRSLRSGWYLYFLFHPVKYLPKKMLYSLWKQFQLKVFKGDLKALVAIILAVLDLIRNSFKIFKDKNRLTTAEYNRYLQLSDTVVYWFPKKNK